MDLVIIYGPPATGKLTVAKELEKLTGYKVFHNHLSVDLVHSLLDFGEGRFWGILREIRIKMLTEAAKHNVKGVIFTFCYVSGEDDALMRAYLGKLKNHNVKSRLVHLYCEKEELFRRVTSESRKPYKKIKKASVLKDQLQRKEFYKPYPYPDTLQIDNTRIPPKKAAQMIAKHFRLKQ